MRTGAIAYLGGILLLLQLPELPDVRWCLLLPPLIPLLFLAGRQRIPLVFLCGFLAALWHANSIVSSTIPPESEGRDLIATGTIISIPQQTVTGRRFQFLIDTLTADGEPLALTGKVRLSWYRHSLALHAGERWQLKIRLKHPHGLMNPGGFDYEAWLLQNHLLATGYVRKDSANRRLAMAQGLYRWRSLRHTLAQRLDQSLQGKPYAGLIRALAIGERHGITDEQWQVLLRSGTNHLVAISGLHISLVAGLGVLLMRRLWAAVPWLVLRWPAPSAGALAGLMLAFVYAALAGFSIPTQRALIMVAVALLAILLQRHHRPSQVLAVALICVLVFDPLAVLSAGFWLSFAAVAIILLGMNNRLTVANSGPNSEPDSQLGIGSGFSSGLSAGLRSANWSGWWWRWGRLHVLVTIGLIPLLLILFQRLPLFSPLANFIAVPWVSLLVVPMVLLGTVLLPLSDTLAQWPLSLANLFLAGLWPLLAAIANLELAQWSQHVPLAWTLLPALIGTLVLLLPRGLPGRWLGLVWLLPALLIAPPGPEAGEVHFTLLDVGQGLSSVVRTQNHVLVYDTGPRFSANFDAGEAAVVPFLRQQGVTAIDHLIIGHGDNDHIGGAASVQQHMAIHQVSSSVPDKIPWTSATLCRDRQRWQWDGVDFEVIHPNEAKAWQGNNASCVLRISTAGHSILLSGDIEAFAEHRLVATRGSQLLADVLVVPHHGSKTSSGQAFIDAVDPAYALFPVGYRNRFQFPRPEVLKRYVDRGSDILRTDHDGAITLSLKPGEEISVRRSRHPARRFWLRHHRFH